MQTGKESKFQNCLYSEVGSSRQGCCCCHFEIKRYPWSSCQLCWGFFFFRVGAPVLCLVSVRDFLPVADAREMSELSRAFAKVLPRWRNVSSWEERKHEEDLQPNWARGRNPSNKVKTSDKKKKLRRAMEFIYAADGVYMSESNYIGADWCSLIEFKSMRTEQLRRLRAL